MTRLQVELTKAIVQAGRLVALSPETFAPALDASDWEHIRSIRDRINRWADAMEAARPKSLSRGHLTVSVRRQKGNRTTVRTHKAILKLMDRHPGAATVRDALAAEGMTMDDYLASAA